MVGGDLVAKAPGPGQAVPVRELDHLIVFLRGPDDVDALRPALAGLILGCGGFVRHRLLASSDTAGHVSVPRMLVCVDTASAPDGCQVVRCFVAWARR